MSHNLKRCFVCNCHAFPSPAKKRFAMRKNYNLSNLCEKSAHFLDGCQRTVLIETRNGIVDNGNLAGRAGIQID